MIGGALRTIDPTFVAARRLFTKLRAATDVAVALVSAISTIPAGGGLGGKTVGV